jgi:hypothetical protein
MALITLAWILVLVAPYAVLALAGVLLWKRHRSVATVMIAVGFVATFVGQAAGIHLNSELSAAVRAQQDASLVLAQHRRIYPLLTHYAALCGLWTAAVGMLWHAASRYARIS